MSQQLAAGQGGGRGDASRPRNFPRCGGGGAGATTKAYELPITEISKYTFNTGEKKFSAQFTESRKRVVGYVQRSGMEESYLVAETIRMGTTQTIALLAMVNRGSQISREEATETQGVAQEGVRNGRRPVLTRGAQQAEGDEELGERTVGPALTQADQENRKNLRWV